MKMFIALLACLLAVAQAAPAAVNDAETTILKYENDNIGIDGYNFAYETSDGVSRSESAVLKNAGTENASISVRGTITWTGADGVVYTLNYIADENGFQPEGDHLPKVNFA